MPLADHRRGLRDRLQGPLAQLQHEVTIAHQMAQGPDPEEALAVLRGVQADLAALLRSISK